MVAGNRRPWGLLIGEVCLRGNREVAIGPATLCNYSGRYQLASNVFFVVTVQNVQLLVKLGDQPTFPVYPSARDRFFNRVVDAKIDFERNEGGHVNGLILRQNGTEKHATKVSD